MGTDILNINRSPHYSIRQLIQYQAGKCGQKNLINSKQENDILVFLIKFRDSEINKLPIITNKKG